MDGMLLSRLLISRETKVEIRKSRNGGRISSFQFRVSIFASQSAIDNRKSAVLTSLTRRSCAPLHSGPLRNAGPELPILVLHSISQLHSELPNAPSAPWAASLALRPTSSPLSHPARARKKIWRQKALQTSIPW